MRWRLFPFFAALAAMNFLPPSAFAGPAETRAAADALFREGRALVKQGNFAEGCAKLEGSQNLDPAPGTLLALADCFEKDGRLASAWSTWNDAVVLAKQRNDKRRQETAEKRAKQLEPKLPKLQINVASNSGVEGLVVKRNDKIVESSVFGSAIPVDPGSQTIAAAAPGHEPWSTSVDIKPEPGVTNVSVPVLVKLPDAPKVEVPQEKPKPPPKPVEPPPLQSNAQRAIGIALTTVGILGVVGGGAAGGLTFLNVNKAKGECDGSNPPRCSQAGLDAYRTADLTAS
ncbi:MAG TPA: hypothetical protein PK156_24260, partial [Polyangium sp.]|nr:hypothetical protein [Polyangium sp.]